MSDPSDGGGRRAQLLGDEADLFRVFNRRLARIIRKRTGSPWDIVEDAGKVPQRGTFHRG